MAVDFSMDLASKQKPSCEVFCLDVSGLQMCRKSSFQVLLIVGHTIAIDMTETCGVMNGRRHATWKCFTAICARNRRQEILRLRQNDRCFGGDLRYDCGGPDDVFAPRWPEATRHWPFPLLLLHDVA